jgi:hypothetical protein
VNEDFVLTPVGTARITTAVTEWIDRQLSAAHTA